MGIDQTQACVLYVTIVTPKHANPNESNRFYPLSFCAYPSPSARFSFTPPINPDLKPLTIKYISPQPGTVQFGSTINPLIISFDQSVDPTSVTTAATQGLEFTAVVRKDNLKNLIISPKSPWQSNVRYSIKVNKGFLSQDGLSQSKEDIEVEYSVIEFTPPVYDQEP